MQFLAYSYRFDTIESGQMLYTSVSFLAFIPYIIVMLLTMLQVKLHNSIFITFCINYVYATIFNPFRLEMTGKLLH